MRLPLTRVRPTRAGWIGAMHEGQGNDKHCSAGIRFVMCGHARPHRPSSAPKDIQQTIGIRPTEFVTRVEKEFNDTARKTMASYRRRRSHRFRNGRMSLIDSCRV